MNEYREEEIKTNKVHKSVEVRVTAQINEECWKEFTNITEGDAIECTKESFLDKLPWGWEVEDIEVETIVHDDGD